MVAPEVTEKAAFILWRVKIAHRQFSNRTKLHMWEEPVDFNEVNPTAREDLSDHTAN